MHVLPQLRKLEERFPEDLVVVGVHSPKYPAEKDTQAVREAVLRLEIDHPVVSDPEMRTWSEYAVNAWPTLMLIDPAGKVIGKHEGELNLEEFEPLIAGMLAEFESKGMLDHARELVFHPEQPPETLLLFPGKVLADEASGRLFVADSGHHRILISDLQGRVLQVVGSGERGFQDGGPAEAAFDKPQGLALDGDRLYVADTWNHSIRRIDLATGRVVTVAGTGQLARRVKEGPATASPLRSPWDVVFLDGVLYIAMAGTHQLWVLDVQQETVARYAGSGREALTDGVLARATFAQPSGLASDGKRLYAADSETSSVRSVDLPGSGDQVRTLAGQGLFVFGDADGVGDQVRLQHVIGVAYDPSSDLLYLADSYNHRIKRMDPATGQTVSILGNGKAHWQDGEGTEAGFSEPGGVSVAGGRLYVADTNNHAIRVAGLEDLQVSSVEFTGLPTSHGRPA